MQKPLWYIEQWLCKLLYRWTLPMDVPETRKILMFFCYLFFNISIHWEQCSVASKKTLLIRTRVWNVRLNRKKRNNTRFHKIDQFLRLLLLLVSFCVFLVFLILFGLCGVHSLAIIFLAINFWIFFSYQFIRTMKLEFSIWFDIWKIHFYKKNHFCKNTISFIRYLKEDIFFFFLLF